MHTLQADLMQQHVGASERAAFFETATHIAQEMLLEWKVVRAVDCNTRIEGGGKLQRLQHSARVAAVDPHTAGDIAQPTQGCLALKNADEREAGTKRRAGLGAGRGAGTTCLRSGVQALMLLTLYSRAHNSS
jgi:hypothetical protein